MPSLGSVVKRALGSLSWLMWELPPQNKTGRDHGCAFQSSREVAGPQERKNHRLWHNRTQVSFRCTHARVAESLPLKRWLSSHSRRVSHSARGFEVQAAPVCPILTKSSRGSRRLAQTSFPVPVSALPPPPAAAQSLGRSWCCLNLLSAPGCPFAPHL